MPLASPVFDRHFEAVHSWFFLHPWLLLGLVGVALPILIHLIGRRRAPSIKFAAFDFLFAVNKRLARRERLRQVLLLLLRCLAVAALAFGVARPLPNRPAAATTTNRRVALVLDTSASMAFVDHGVTLLDRAKEGAREILTHLTSGDRVTLVLAGAELKVPFAAPTADTVQVRAVIDAVTEARGVADIGAAIDQALAPYGPEAAGTALFIVSDLSQNSFEHLRPTALEPPPEVRLVDAALRDEAVALANLALERVTVEGGGEAASERSFRVEVHNYGDENVTGKALELVIGERVTQRGYVDVPPRSTAVKVLSQTFDGPGVYAGELRFSEPDGYAVDDHIGFTTVISPGIKVLAVDGDPRTTPYEDELFFLQRALEVVPKGDPSLQLRIVTVDELTHATGELDVAGFDVVILANIGTLPKSTVESLRQFVRNGGGLVITVGDHVQFEAANEELGDLLPHPLRDRQRAADPDAGTPPLGIGEVDWEHPVLQGLGLPAEESLRASRTSVYFNLDVGVKARTLLRFDNGAPALVERSEGKGRVLLLTTSADVDWSDLALRSVYPALLQRLVRYAGGAADVEVMTETKVGGTVEISLPTGVRALALLSPKGVRREVTVSDASQRRARFADLQEVGLYRAEVLRTEWATDPRLDLVVNPSLSESSFLPVQAAQISEALGGDKSGREVQVLVGTNEKGDPFESRGPVSYLLLGLCLLFISESFLASRG